MNWFKKSPAPKRKRVIIEIKGGQLYDAEVVEELGDFVKIKLLRDTDNAERNPAAGLCSGYERVRVWETIIVPRDKIKAWVPT